MTNKSKHLILEILYREFEKGTENTGHGLTVTDLGRSLTNIEIHAKTNLKIKDIDRLCTVLIENGHLKLFKEDTDNKAHRYLITPQGQKAYLDRHYITEYNKENRLKWFQIIMPTVTILTFLLTLQKHCAQEVRLKKLETELQYLDNELRLQNEALNRDSSSRR